MATRYTLVMTFGGDESEAPEDWQKAAIASVANMINRGYLSGEFPIYEGDKTFMGIFHLEPEDE